MRSSTIVFAISLQVQFIHILSHYPQLLCETSLYFPSNNLTLLLLEVHQTLKAVPIGLVIRLIIFKQLVWQSKPRLQK